jgi:isochorismate synthase
MQVTGGEVHTLGLAGSAPRGTSAEEDAEIEQRLLSSDKDKHEHAVVTRRLLKVLNEHCVDVWEESGPGVLKLPHLQHLCTRLGARLGESGLLQLVAALHPTPALGGHPSVEALRWLNASEPLDRGWYAAPIGWVDADGEGEFAVAIRSALVSGRTASLYAGCGVVAQSEPAAEYRETEVKLQGMLAALGAA